MTKQTPDDLAASRVADEVRAELARQRRTASELAESLGVGAHTIGRRLSGETPFNVIELARVARFLGTTATDLVTRAERAERVA
jgi:transcriptional regulator with XRE-family HTH domain